MRYNEFGLDAYILKNDHLLMLLTQSDVDITLIMAVSMKSLHHKKIFVVFRDGIHTVIILMFAPM
jgi:hypothetical protein